MSLTVASAGRRILPSRSIQRQGLATRHQQADSRCRAVFFVLGMAHPVMGGPCGRPYGLPVPVAGSPTRTVPPTRLATDGGKLNHNRGYIMSNAIQKFQFHNHPIRIFPHENGVSFWAVAKDVADILGYTSAKDFTRQVPDSHKGRQKVPTPSGDQYMLCVDEAGLYRAVLRRI